MRIIGKKAPSFSAPAVVDGRQIISDFSLDQYLGKKHVVLFFYPKDFTFVCPTELLALQDRLEDFEQRNTAVVACSTDTEETHWAWLHVHARQGGIQGVTYPLVADTSKSIAANYGVLAGDWYVDEKEQLQFQGTPISYRGVFIIDPEGIIQHAHVNNLSLGRSVDEILRTLDMLHHTEKYGHVCPVNWSEGKDSLEPTPQGLMQYLEKVSTTDHHEGGQSSPSKGIESTTNPSGGKRGCTNRCQGKC